MVSTHGTPEASAWDETGITVSGVAVARRKSTESCCTICDATVAARAEDDWLSPEMISTAYFLPPMVSPLASADRTRLSTYPLDWVNTDSSPVSGLMNPIFIVPPDAELGEVELFNAREQPATRPASPPPRATPAAPRKLRLLSWLGLLISESVMALISESVMVSSAREV